VSGEHWTCKAVVSNADPVTTLGGIVNPALVPKRVAQKIKRMRPSGSVFCILAGTDLDLPARGLTSGNLIHYGEYDINKIYREIMTSEAPVLSNCLFINWSTNTTRS